MCLAGHSVALWTQVAARMCSETSLHTDARITAFDYVQMLEATALCAQRLSRRWNTGAGKPRRVLRLRAHANRVTAMKLVTGRMRRVPGSKKAEIQRFLVTGSVDGFVRIWDLERVVQHRGELDATADFGDNESPRPDPIDPTEEIKRSSKHALVAEVDTGGDVTAVDAVLQSNGRELVLAVGSYYVSDAAAAALTTECGGVHRLGA